MEKIILYVDDAVYAREFLASQPTQAGGTGPLHWVLVASAPRMTHRISKWVSHSARENWRGRWFAKVQEQLVPLLQGGDARVTTVLAKGPLTELTRQLKLTYGAARVVDARRPRIGGDLEPVSPDQRPPGPSGWARPGTALGIGALLVLVGGLVD
jgi:hypothetical protein